MCTYLVVPTCDDVVMAVACFSLKHSSALGYDDEAAPLKKKHHHQLFVGTYAPYALYLRVRSDTQEIGILLHSNN